MIVYPLTVIHLISPCNIKLFNCLPARVVMIGRPVHGIANIASLRHRYKIYLYVSFCLKQSTNLMVSQLLLLPWYTAITGYWISSNNSNSQQQLTAGYRQTSKSLPGLSWPTGVKTTTSRI